MKEIKQQCLIFCNRKIAQGRNPVKKMGAGNVGYKRQEV